MMLPGQATVEVVEIQAADGLTIRGERWEGDHDRRVLVLHDAGDDLDSVRSLALALAVARFTTLAIDQIGHGASDGEPGCDRLGVDIRAVIEVFGHEDFGVYLVGVGEAAVGCLEVAATVHPSALAFVSPHHPSRLDPAVIEGDSAPVLVAYGSWDESAEATARQLIAARPGPFQLVQLPTKLQAAALLRDELGAQVINHAVGYLRQIAPLQRTEARDAADE